MNLQQIAQLGRQAGQTDLMLLNQLGRGFAPVVTAPPQRRTDIMGLIMDQFVAPRVRKMMGTQGLVPGGLSSQNILDYQDARQAAMEKTGFSRTVLKALQGAGGKAVRSVTGGVPKPPRLSGVDDPLVPPLSILPPKTRALLRLRRGFPTVRNITSKELAKSTDPDLHEMRGWGGYWDGWHANVLPAAGEVGSKSHLKTKRHEVLHGLFGSARGEGGMIPAGPAGLPGMMQPAYKAHQLARSLQRPGGRHVRYTHYPQTKFTAPDSPYSPTPLRTGPLYDKMVRMGIPYGHPKNPWWKALLTGNPKDLPVTSSKLSGTETRDMPKSLSRLLAARAWPRNKLAKVPYDVMTGITRLLDEAGATYGGYKGQPIRGAIHAANRTFGPGGISYGWHHRKEPLGLTQALGSTAVTGAGLGGLGYGSWQAGAAQADTETGRKFRRWLRNMGRAE